MGKIIADAQAIPSTPASGAAALYPHSGTKQWTARDDAGKSLSLPNIRNFSTAQQSIVTSDTYLTGSSITIPTGLLLQAGTTFKWRFGATRSGAGTAAPVWIVRVGTAGTTADTARLTFTSPSAQTNASDSMWMDLTCVLRNTGASGVMAGIFQMMHANQTTGAASVQSVVLSVVSGAFDTTVANSIVGVSFNPGATSTWLYELVHAEAEGI